VLFFVDGFDHYVFDEMLAAGELPSIDRYLIRRGVTVENGITCVPSLTYAASTTLLTGRYPGHHDITGNKWFDRQTLVWKTYNDATTYRDVNADFCAPTIYDALSDRFTVNFQCAVRRGVTETIDNWAESGVSFFFGWHLAADRFVAEDYLQIPRLARKHSRWPDFVHAYFPGTDARGHEHGPESPNFRQVVRNVDRQIGRICDGLEQADLLDRTFLILVSDHGMAPCSREQFLDLTAWLRTVRGWRVHEGRLDGGTLEQRQRYFNGVDVAVVNGGNRHYQLHIRGAEGWSSRPDFTRCRDVLTTGEPSLATLPGVFAAACRKGPDQAWICGRDGSAVVTRKRHDKAVLYRYDIETGDPLGYTTDPDLAGFVESGWHDSRAWLAATAATRCPDTVAQLVEFFDSPRSPDIAIFAAEGWDFAPENVGGHGSIVRRDMWVPMIFAGPGIRRGARIPVARVCDIAPTIVEFLAGPERLIALGRIDGVSLVSQLCEAPPDASQQ